MFKSKFFVTLAALAAIAAIVAGGAVAGSPAPKVTGDVTFTNLGYTQHWVFSAQDLGTAGAKGSVLDEWNGSTSTAKVIKANVLDAHTATFTTEITSTDGMNPYVHVGDQFSYTVHDGGEGTSGSGDSFEYEGYTDGSGFHPAGSPNHYDITSGNIQIH